MLDLSSLKDIDEFNKYNVLYVLHETLLARCPP